MIKVVNVIWVVVPIIEGMDVKVEWGGDGGGSSGPDSGIGNLVWTDGWVKGWGRDLMGEANVL